MKSFDSILRDIFDRRTAAPQIPIEEEADVVEAARHGDERAYVTLLYAYGKVLAGFHRDALRALGREAPRDDIDELRAILVSGMAEAILAYDPAKGARLLHVLRVKLRETLAESGWGQEVPFTVSERTLRRFYGLMAAAEQNVERALELAPEHHMKPETVLDVLAAVRNTLAYDGFTTDDGDDAADPLAYATPISGVVSRDPIQDVEDRVLVEAAFRAVDDQEARVVELAYGFTADEIVPDGKIASKLGTSRTTVRRIRGSALDKMRDELGVAA